MQPSIKREADKNATNSGDIPYVHIINSKDIESHFGTARTQRRKVDVKLLIDENIWQRTTQLAAESGIEISLFVEAALKQHAD